ncbi:hypothetical protein LHA31_08290 [Carnobacterium viridans]|uniref:Uncharacterized protein n=1 Tax=Carnobacterium viridans TaxID=174587 RepID=A0A1H0ZKZ7_9LACT|nr:hypothetical protein [Carnobacterium viridans]UDE94586.1 hypothetical protein LHA31_08290 [Carnobacterium viridans]SDQ27831.1 hypothetical protein SAMN04487752_1569 [Carnobacterium viridans]
MSFEPIERTNSYYNESLLSIDKKICNLLNQRKVVQGKNIFFPPDEVVSCFAEEYDLQEEYLQSIFTTMAMEASLKPMVVPVEFKKYVPVLKMYENNGVIYTVTFIRQYANASVLYLDTDWEEAKENSEDNYNPDLFELSINDIYDCRSEVGGGTTGHMSQNYIISPSLPDDVSGIELIFKEPGRPFKVNSTGFEFTIKLG